MAPTATTITNVPPDLPDPEKFSKLKQSLIKPEHVEALKASWDRLLVEIEKMVEEIKAEGPNFYPSIDWKDVKDNGGKYPEEILEKVKERGCLIVRNVVDRKTCEGWRDSMKEFVTKHPEVGGYPKEKITNWFAFWTEGEVKARSHPEIIALMKTMGQFFYVDDDTLPIDKEAQVVYPDAFRFRPPGQQMSLDLHLDAGAIERWEDPTYREVYAPILEGRWEDFEPWKLDQRAFANCDLYQNTKDRPTATSAFRGFQGWLGLTDVKCGEGTIRMLPNVKLVNAYSILRPFFWADNGEIDLTSPKFPGVKFVGSGQFFLDQYMDHLKQLETVVSIPYANVGDYVFWHCDLAHEVDKVHNGTNESAVFFNAYCPLSVYNMDNMIATRDQFLAGQPPRDFADTEKFIKAEGDYEDHGAKKENILTDDGLRAMGLLDFDENEIGITPGQKLARQMANTAMKTGIIPKYDYHRK